MNYTEICLIRNFDVQSDLSRIILDKTFIERLISQIWSDVLRSRFGRLFSGGSPRKRGTQNA